MGCGFDLRSHGCDSPIKSVQLSQSDHDFVSCRHGSQASLKYDSLPATVTGHACRSRRGICEINISCRATQIRRLAPLAHMLGVPPTPGCTAKYLWHTWYR